MDKKEIKENPGHPLPSNVDFNNLSPNKEGM